MEDSSQPSEEEEEEEEELGGLVGETEMEENKKRG